MVLNGSWKQLFLAVTSLTSALEDFYNEIRYMNLRFTYLLTYSFSKHPSSCSMFPYSLQPYVSVSNHHLSKHAWIHKNVVISTKQFPIFPREKLPYPPLSVRFIKQQKYSESCNICGRPLWQFVVEPSYEMTLRLFDWLLNLINWSIKVSRVMT